MLKIENTEVLGWEHAIRGMRNPMNSWEKSDSNLYHTSVYFDECNERWETDGHRFMIGPPDRCTGGKNSIHIRSGLLRTLARRCIRSRRRSLVETIFLGSI